MSDEDDGCGAFGSPKEQAGEDPLGSSAQRAGRVAANLFGASPALSQSRSTTCADVSEFASPAPKSNAASVGASPSPNVRQPLAEVTQLHQKHENLAHTAVDLPDKFCEESEGANIADNDETEWMPRGRVKLAHVCNERSDEESLSVLDDAHVPPLLRATMDPEHNVPVVEPSEVARSLLSEKHVEMHIVDCRYPYEYDGGHIKGATNVYEPASMANLLQTLESKGPQVALVLHCEFSSQRAPRMFRHIRNSDRMTHMQDYPRLTFPHVYVLNGGYKAFVHQWPSLCTPPNAYRTMHAPGFAMQLRHYNVQWRTLWQQWPKHSPAW